MSPHQLHTGTTRGYIDIEPGTRVAHWHMTYVDQCDPIPGTVTHVGAKFLTVKWDGKDKPTRIEPRNVTYWEYPED